MPQSTLRNRVSRYQAAGLAQQRAQAGARTTWHIRRDAVEAFAQGAAPFVDSNSRDEPDSSGMMDRLLDLQAELAEARATGRATEDRLRADLIAAGEALDEANRRIDQLVRANRALSEANAAMLDGYDRSVR